MKAQMVYSILYTLLQRHEEAAKYYRRAAELAREDDLKRYLGSLADYRAALGKEVRHFLEDSSPVPVRNRPRKDITPLLAERWSEMESALEKSDRARILSLCHATEQELFHHYQQVAFGNENAVAGGILDLLEKQHQQVMEVTRKTERLERVPQDKLTELQL